MVRKLMELVQSLWISYKIFHRDTTPKMLFKAPQMEVQYNNAPSKLREIAEFYAALSAQNNVIALVTRVTDAVYGSSGVHEAGRGIDFRNEYVQNGSKKWLLPLETMEEIVNRINTKYPRVDGKPVALYHSFENGPYHMHLQIPYAWLTKEEMEKWNNGNTARLT